MNHSSALSCGELSAVGRATHLSSSTKTLNHRSSTPIGYDIEPIEANHAKMSKWETMKKKNRWKQKVSQSQNEFEEWDEQRETRTGRYSGHAVYSSWGAACLC